MGIFSNKAKDGELLIVFDIGTSTVSGAVFQTTKSEVPKIIFSTNEPIIILEEIDIDQFLSLTIKSLSVVVSRLSRFGMGSPAKIFCVLSSLWYGSQTRVIKFIKDTPFVFTSKLADSLTQKEISLFLEEHVEKYIHTGVQVLPIELKNMKTVLNGYETGTPLNKKAQELEMTIFISMSSKQFLDQVQEVIASNFHFKGVEFSSAVMVSFAVIRDMFKDPEGFLLVDIDGEMTDIAMIKRGILSESVSFPIGRNFLTRGLAKGLSSTPEEANSLLSLHKDGHAEAEVSEDLELVIDKLKKEWLHKFQESLANISNDISIPSTIYLSVDKDLVDFFRKIIENEQFNQYTLTESKFKVVFLSAEIFHNRVTFEKDMDRDSNLVNLLIDSIYINRFLR